MIPGDTGNPECSCLDDLNSKLDLLGSAEEHFHRGPDGTDVSWFGVVWFENRLN